MKLDELLCGISYRVTSGSLLAAPEVQKIVTSCQTGLENALFLCSKASLRDTAAAVRKAYGYGCRLFLASCDIAPGEGSCVIAVDEPDRYAGLLCDRLLGDPARTLTVLGITGALHSTRTALLLEQLLQHAGYRVSSLTRAGMQQNGVRNPATVLLADAVAIWECLADARRTGAEIVILELTAHQLAHFAAESIPFAAVLLTDDTFEPGEAQGFADKEHFTAAQDLLLGVPTPFTVLPPARNVACHGRVLRIGQDVQALSKVGFFDQKTGYGTRFLLNIDGECATVKLPLPGELSIAAALGAAALARVAGLDLAHIAAGLGAARLDGFTEYLGLPYGRCVYIDAAYSPRGIEEVLRVFRPVCEGRLSVLFGSVGGRAKGRRLLLGRMAQVCADHIYLSADDPDDEDPSAICADILEGIGSTERVTVIPDRRAAILRAVRELRPGDVLLLAGKGCDTRQLIGGVHQAFCERNIVHSVKF